MRSKTIIITESQLKDIINEVRYVDIANRFGDKHNKSLGMGWDDSEELEKKIVNDSETIGWLCQKMANKRDNNDFLTFKLAPSEATDYSVEQVKAYLKNVYGYRYPMSFKEFGNHLYVSFHLKKDQNYTPIGKHEKIRVFHGTDIKTAINIAKNGLSGKELTNRTYSYEYGMNPNGLFVTTDFYTAKDFGYHYDDQVILEFTADSNDLDTPVWNGQGTYFGQMTNPQPFHNRQERISQKLSYQRSAEMSEYPFVAQSDNPSMAERIFNNNEHQALYYGDIKPNQIKRFWFKEKGTNEYIPMSFAEFAKKFRNYSYDKTEYGRTSTQKIEREKLYWPNEEWQGLDDFVDRIRKQHEKMGWKWDDSSEEYATELGKKWESAGWGNEDLSLSDLGMMKQFMFPKQIIGILGADRYRENFDRFYPEWREEGKRV